YVGIFLQNAPVLLRKLVQGVENKQYEQIKISAHSLKTQLNYMGVKEEVSHVHELEQISIYAYRHDEMAALVKNLEKVCAKAFSELEEFLK
ncbi:MAG: Hpt domain-containing protein, partial [Chitinophagaceae bacterium]|nr:Hpt domain-containing protein [Chitinophagaceae bacterium]